jgi:site-specific DNA recombinase
VRAGHVVGGRLYGYRNGDILGEPDRDGRRKRLHVECRVNETEAAVIQRIFELCASGKGCKRIVSTLNEENAPAPPPSTGGRRGVAPSRSWAAYTVREIIHRETYRGVVVWNRVKKRDQWGLKTYLPREESEWLRFDRPELRIVTEEQWFAAHERLDGTRATYLRTTQGQLWGRPASGIESRYLLTGLLTCGLCGGSLVVASRDMKKRRKYVYACSHNRFRGSVVCSNNLWAPMELADREILGAIGRDLLRPKIVSAALVQALEVHRARRTTSGARPSKPSARRLRPRSAD